MKESIALWMSLGQHMALVEQWFTGGRRYIYIYYESLSKFVKKKRLNKIGGNKERCAVDETAVGRVGRMVGKPASKRGSYIRAADRIATRRPCKTTTLHAAACFPILSHRPTKFSVTCVSSLCRGPEA